MKFFSIQTLTFLIVAQVAGLILNSFWLKESIAELMIESLIAGVLSSMIFQYFIQNSVRSGKESAN